MGTKSTFDSDQDEDLKLVLSDINERENAIFLKKSPEIVLTQIHRIGVFRL